MFSDFIEVVFVYYQMLEQYSCDECVCLYFFFNYYIGR